jgi:hypothetical protein
LLARDRVTARAPIESVQIARISVRPSNAGLTPTIDVIPVAGISGDGGCAVWTDKDFVQGESVAYYVRVLQVPTRRWAKNDCDGIQGSKPAACQDPKVIGDIPERAWTSPLLGSSPDCPTPPDQSRERAPQWVRRAPWPPSHVIATRCAGDAGYFM